MTQQEFINNFESEGGWLSCLWSLKFENDFAIFTSTRSILNFKTDFQLNLIFWFMKISNAKGMDVFNNTWMEIDSVNLGELILTVKIKHDLKFED